MAKRGEVYYAAHFIMRVFLLNRDENLSIHL